MNSKVWDGNLKISEKSFGGVKGRRGSGLECNETSLARVLVDTVIRERLTLSAE